MQNMTTFETRERYFAGFAPKPREDVTLQEGLQTQKYADIILPKIEICSHCISNLKVYVTIDYEAGRIVTEPLKSAFDEDTIR